MEVEAFKDWERPSFLNLKASRDSLYVCACVCRCPRVWCPRADELFRVEGMHLLDVSTDAAATSPIGGAMIDRIASSIDDYGC